MYLLNDVKSLYRGIASLEDNIDSMISRTSLFADIPISIVLATVCVSRAHVLATPCGPVRPATCRYARTIVRSIMGRASVIAKVITAAVFTALKVKK